MKPSFRRLDPHSKNMITEYGARPDEPFAVDLLCVECGWEGHFEDGSKDHFFKHSCRLVTESVSTAD